MPAPTKKPGAAASSNPNNLVGKKRKASSMTKDSS